MRMDGEGGLSQCIEKRRNATRVHEMRGHVTRVMPTFYGQCNW